MCGNGVESEAKIGWCGGPGERSRQMDGEKQEEARPGQDASKGDASPECRRWRGHVTGASRCVFPFPLIFASFRLPVYILWYNTPRKAAALSEGTDMSGHRRSGSSRIDHLCDGRHAQDAVKTVLEVSPATRKRSWYMSEESQEVKRVSISASTSRSSELRLISRSCLQSPTR
jgi:hypothetical protein